LASDLLVGNTKMNRHTGVGEWFVCG